jgi:transposase
MTATVLSGPERRRRWTRAEKLRLIEETLAPEAKVADVARRYDIHSNLLHSWRGQARQGVLTGSAEANPAPADAIGFASVAIAPPVRDFDHL